MTASDLPNQTARTCNVYFTLFRDANRNGTPESREGLFNTHSIYSCADTAFTYSFSSMDGTSVERGSHAWPVPLTWASPFARTSRPIG
ncbi:hypothetical protein GCM10010840_14300 [Deinococcus aerolatus]|uniref:Uncharacterized protein n=1 Tax=Deinococcus aerolatus TaxID=522487 RepID=A0ABQ2G6S3_9DEIO|nr:hypothetical protein [Deinococcus aerolatus]GGL77476.1 hypothetical protein GCM10010840_14300 [Deinococcus aerolatus]